MDKEMFEDKIIQGEFGKFIEFLLPFDRMHQSNNSWQDLSSLDLWMMYNTFIEGCRLEAVSQSQSTDNSQKEKKETHKVESNKKELLLGFFERYSLPMCFAFRLSEELCQHMLKNPKLSQYEIFVRVLSSLDLSSEPLNLKQWVTKCTQTFLPAEQLKMENENGNKMAAKVILELEALNRIYDPVKNFISNDFEKEFKVFKEVLGDKLELTIQALLLEHLGTMRKRDKNLTSGAAQNTHVDLGLLLSEKGHPLFELGTRYVISGLIKEDVEAKNKHEIIKRNKERMIKLISAFCAFKMQQYYHDTPKEAALQFQATFDEIYDSCDKIAEPNILTISQELCNKLREKKKLDSLIVVQWVSGAIRLMRAYECPWKPTSKSFRILIEGDSVAAGVGTPHDKRAERCVNQIQTLLTQACPINDLKSTVEIINSSIGGRVIEQGTEGLKKDIDLHKPELLIFNLIANNIFYGNMEGADQDNIYDIEKKIREFVEIGKSKVSNDRIVWIVGLPETSAFKLCSFAKSSINSLVEKIALEQGIKIIKIDPECLKEDNFLSDGMHFTIPAQRKIAEQISNELIKVIANIEKERLKANKTTETRNLLSQGLPNPPLVPHWHQVMGPLGPIQLPVMTSTVPLNMSPNSIPMHSYPLAAR